MNFYKKNCCLHFLSIILTYINIHLFKVNHFVISELTKHVSKCKKCDKRFAKKVAKLEIKLVLDFHITEAVVLRCSVENMFQKFRKIHKKTPVPETIFQ